LWRSAEAADLSQRSTRCHLIEQIKDDHHGEGDMYKFVATALSMYPAHAKTSLSRREGGDEQSSDIQDIVVTARRSSESLQAVPVAVTALSGQFLDRQNMVDATAIPQFVPNITIAQQSSSLSAAAVFIRGIGNNEPSALSEQVVGIYLDGVYLARAAGALFDLVDLERIEVLRGPQGTTFGRNTIGGAVQPA
jgi:iron complex outermembrane receptor protein